MGCYCHCSKLNVQVMVFSVLESNDFPEEKKCCGILFSFLEAFLKGNQGEDLRITLKTIKWVFIFLLHFSFFLSTPLLSAYRETHGNC